MSDDTSPDAGEFRCLVPFPDGSASFVNGFETGMVWQRMIAKEAEIGGLDEIAFHAENIEVFRRMAGAQGYDIEVDEPKDGWAIILFKKRRHKFSVVE